MLEMHNWPGNIRELENVVERAVITAQETVQAKDIYIERRQGNSLNAPMNGTVMDSAVQAMSNITASEKQGWLPGTTLDDIEKSVILEALTYHSGNRTHTAKALGISIRTLRNKLADYRRSGMTV